MHYCPCIGIVLCSETQEPRIFLNCSLNLDVYQYHSLLLQRGNGHRTIVIITGLAVNIVLLICFCNYRTKGFYISQLQTLIHVG